MNISPFAYSPIRVFLYSMFATPTLTVDLAAIAANWQRLRSRFTGEETAAVVKANAYGLGANEVAAALEKAGCHTFFVATLEEGISLRAALPDVRILILHGVQQGEEFAFRQHRLIPVLNSPAQLQRWRPVAAEHRDAVSALHIDTAMARLGLTATEWHTLRNDPALFEACRISLLMSHLAFSSDADDPRNAAQLADFHAAIADISGIPRSLANSGGILMPAEYHHDLARPGCALYGIHPAGIAGDQSMLQQTATLRAPILQVRTLDKTQPVSYSGLVQCNKGTRIATVACGYADGYLRSLTSSGAYGLLHGKRTPLLGRVTMDMLLFDVTHIDAAEGDTLTLLGTDGEDRITIDQLADWAGTIGYEILTRLGTRIQRQYL